MISPVTSNAYERDGTSSRCDLSVDVAGADAPKTRPIAERFCFFGEPHFLSGAIKMNEIIKRENIRGSYKHLRRDLLLVPQPQFVRISTDNSVPFSKSNLASSLPSHTPLILKLTIYSFYCCTAVNLPLICIQNKLYGFHKQDRKCCDIYILW